ncbi:MAG: GTP-binding protein, partial [Oscillospiraceae bacterium]|nr:GTP-binding protein [Oscillospiraceae bacterium]
MSDYSPAPAQKNLCVGLVAHVDAGKTTLAEAMLYLSGTVKKLGRVDHRSSFLDTHSLERQRGITIFSKQAMLDWADTAVTLLDTPGHVDFSAEMERTLPVLDCAVLVISGSDGVQAHTETLWRLLKRHRIPTFLFITKMDLAGADETALMEELRARLDGSCV